MVPDRGSDNLRNIFIMILEKFLFRQYSMAGISKKAGDLKTMNTGDIAPGFTLPDKDGKMISLSDFAGKMLYFTFIQRITLPAAPGRRAVLPPIFLNLKSGISLSSVSAATAAPVTAALLKNTICRLFCFLIRSFRRSGHTASGRRKNFTAKFPWELSVRPLSSAGMVLS